MKQSISAIAVVVLLTGGASLAAQQQAPPTAPAAQKTEPAKASTSPAGKWIMNLESPQGAMTVNLEVKIDGENKVTGTLEGPQGPTPIAGEVKDGVLGFVISFDAGGTAMEIYFEGKVNAEGRMTGTVSLGDMGSFAFTADRAKGL